MATATAVQNGRATTGDPVPAVKIRPPSGWAALRLGEIWHFRDLWLTLAGRDLRLRYKQTFLGIAWVVIQPLMAAAIFAFVFGRVANLPSEGLPAFPYAFTGLMAFRLFSNVLTRASGCLVENSHLISKVFFPRLVLPLSTVPSALVDFAVSAGVLAVIMAWYGLMPGPALLLLPLWLVLLTALALGTGLIASSLAVTYRDVMHVLPFVAQLLLFASPVAYSVLAVPEETRDLYTLNPLVAPLVAFRWSLLRTVPPDGANLVYATLTSIAVLVTGLLVFKRMERNFADVV